MKKLKKLTVLPVPVSKIDKNINEKYKNINGERQ